MAKLDALQAIKLRKTGDLGDDAAVFAPAQNATDVTSTTAVAVKAAVAGKSIRITRATFVNKTPAEAAVLILADDASTPVTLLTVAASTGAGNGGVVDMEFEPPIEVAVGEGVTLEATGSLGDSVVTIQGFTVTP